MNDRSVSIVFFRWNHHAQKVICSVFPLRIFNFHSLLICAPTVPRPGELANNAMTIFLFNVLLHWGCITNLCHSFWALRNESKCSKYSRVFASVRNQSHSFLIVRVEWSMFEIWPACAHTIWRMPWRRKSVKSGIKNSRRCHRVRHVSWTEFSLRKNASCMPAAALTNMLHS